MQSLMALLTGRHAANTPLSKRLDTNEHSNVLIFISGHGGDEFMKFQDYEEISARDIAHGIHEMSLKKRFKNMLFVVDTCQASTLGSLISTPNVISLSSSKKDENSYAFHSNTHLGLSVIDRFSYKLVEYFQHNGQHLGKKGNFKSVGDLYRSLHPRFLQSTPVIEVSAGTVSTLDQIPLKRFFDERLVVSQLSGENMSFAFDVDVKPSQVTEADAASAASSPLSSRTEQTNKPPVTWLSREAPRLSPHCHPTTSDAEYPPISTPPHEEEEEEGEDGEGGGSRVSSACYSAGGGSAGAGSAGASPSSAGAASASAGCAGAGSASASSAGAGSEEYDCSAATCTPQRTMTRTRSKSVSPGSSDGSGESKHNDRKSKVLNDQFWTIVLAYLSFFAPYAVFCCFLYSVTLCVYLLIYF
jgi:hypothetical protein